MNLIFASLLALGMAVPAQSSAYLRMPPAQHDLANTREGEISIQIGETTGEDMSVACNMILLEAFDASYKEVYGFDGMMVAIEAETVVPESGDGVVRRKLGKSTTSYVIYWVSAHHAMVRQ